MPLEALRGHEVLDRGLLVGQYVCDDQGAPAKRSEVLRRPHTAAHDHEVRRHALADQELGCRDQLGPALRPTDEACEPDRDAVCGQPEQRLAACAGDRGLGLAGNAVVDDRDGQPDRKARRNVGVDRDRRITPALHENGDGPAPAVAPVACKCRAKMPHELCPVAMRDPRGTEQRRVVQVHEREPVAPHQL